MKIAVCSLTLLCISLLCLFSADATVKPFDVRRHLSTVTRYDVSRDTSNVASFSSAIPDGCEAIHLNLVARHGTRSPTKKRIKELDRLAVRLAALVEEANHEGSSEASKIPSWIRGWESPWKGRMKGGELTDLGEQELYRLSLRVSDRFPEIFSRDYHPDLYPIKATQVPRAAASAVAFGIGLFSGKGTLGSGQHRAFSVVSESRASDNQLRFHDNCATYKSYRESREPEVEKLKEPIIEEITSALISRHHLNFKRQDVASLWFLCKQQASLLDITDQACGLFSETEILLLEWTDDLEFFLLKGYGKSINYWMGVPLLRNIFQTMQEAIRANEESLPGGMYERAQLRFAHAETIVPFSCLLGLFLEGDEYKKIQRSESLDLPPKPPQKRNWRGSSIAPFAGNNMLVLYQCRSKQTDQNISYHVQVLHNEVPVSLPACGTDFCPFEIFKERVVDPLLKHEFDNICSVKNAVGDVVEVPKPCSWSCKFLNFLSGFFSSSQPQQEKSEL
ncbi:multiple inositol polyphosphate phosphatase 1 isoform X1 [Carex littledalei]|uniref:Multiple inositol polyphosphate phosphatase 1 n=1 Tax=Carex littledalei TaxID=544730 RepID=A0A833R3H5_9POAL|nr:multiple inositol polyphosphate phosphatase 1 isoform X1 [Carex littledalei]